MSESSNQVLKLFFESRVIVRLSELDNIEVQPGVFSSIYINLKSPLSDYKTRRRLCHLISKKIPRKTDYICGIESGGNYFAAATADILKKKLIFFRKETKRYNIKDKFVGLAPQKGDRVLIVDDVISSGNTIAKVVNELKKFGCKMQVVVVFSYCWEKVISRNLNVKIISLVDAFQLVDYGLSKKFISKRNAEMIRDYIKREETRVYRPI